MHWVSAFIGSIIVFISSLLGIHPTNSLVEKTTPVSVSTPSTKTDNVNIPSPKPTIVENSNSLSWTPPSSTNQIYSIRDGKVFVQSGGNPLEVSGADAVTFMVTFASNNHNVKNTDFASLIYRYAKDKNTVYYRSLVDGDLIPVNDIDVLTFVVVDRGDAYDSQDKNHKYFASGIACEDPTRKTCSLYNGPGTGKGHWYQN